MRSKECDLINEGEEANLSSLPQVRGQNFPGGSDGRVCLQCVRPRFDPWVGKIPWRRAWQHTPVFLSGESPWTEEPGRLQSMGSHELDMTD